MKKTRSKFLSILMAVCMIVTMLPLSVFAAGELPETSIFSAVTVSPSSAKAGDTVMVTATVKEEYAGGISALTIDVHDYDGYVMDNVYQVPMTRQEGTNNYQKEFVVPEKAAIGACLVRIDWRTERADFEDYLTITGDCTNETDPPAIGTPTVSPTTASPGDPVTVSVPVTDDSAISIVEIYELSLQGYPGIISGESMSFQNGSGTYQYTFEVPANALNGSYDMLILAVDEYGNRTDKTVTGALTITNGGTDIDGPVIDNTLTVNPTSAAQSEPVTVSVTITDASALESVTCEVITRTNLGMAAYGDLTRQGDTDTYQGTFTVSHVVGGLGAYDIIVRARDYYGNVTEKTFEDAFTLIDGRDTTPPTVVSLQLANDAALSGDIVITFSEEMNTTNGAVSLFQYGGAPSTTLTGGVWSNGNTVYTIPYSGLAYGTYNVTIHPTEFEDAAHNNLISSYFSLTIADPDIIVPVPLTGIESPATGNLPDTEATDFSNTQFVVTSITWKQNIIGGPVVSGAFAPATLYYAEILLTAKGTCTFSNLTTPDMDGFTVNEVKPSSYQKGLDRTTLLLTYYDFPATEGSGDTTQIVPAPILGVITPATGNAPQANIPETDHYRTSLEWRHPNGTFDGAAFAPETVYRLQIVLSAKTGYTFEGLTDDDLKGFTVNGIVPSERIPNSDTRIVLQVEFPATGAAGATKPTVLSVEPTGRGVAISGNLIINFSEDMKTTTVGTVQLNDITLTGGQWEAPNQLLVPYSGLDHNTTYTVQISGFADAAGNTMDAVAGGTFTTIAEKETLTVTLTPGDGKVTLAPQTPVTGYTFYYSSDTLSVSDPGDNIDTYEGYKSVYTKVVDIPCTNGTKIFVQVFKVGGSGEIVGFGEASATPTGGSGSGGGGGGDSSSGGSTPIVTPPDPNKPNTGTNAETKVTPTVNAKGSAIVTVPEKSVTDAIKAAQDAAKKAGTEKNGISVTIDATTTKGASDITATLSAKSVDALIKAGVSEVRIKSDVATITIDLAALKAAQAVAAGAIIVSAKPVAVNTLSAAAQKAIGNRPVLKLTLTSGGKAVTNFGSGSVSVAIPYTLGANEKAGNVQAVYVDGSGKVTWLINSSYDTNAKTLLFSTGHFSIFGVGYRADAPVFTDIANHWAKDSIEFVVAGGILAGTGDGKFAPNNAMTRGMFVTALGRLAEVDTKAYTKSSFSDVKTDAYYMPYVEWASKNSIVNGIGDGKFAPDQTISREQMAVIIANYAKAIGFDLPKVHAENTFADHAKIGAWARGAVKSVQMAGIISGKNGNIFDPQGTATRAEVSAVLKRFVELAISTDTAEGWTLNDSGKLMY